MINNSLRKGFLSGLPVFLGYLPIAITFGLVAKSEGISIFATFLFSLLVFAGASQFIAVKLIGSGITPLDIAIVTFLVNLRHLLMSASLSTRIKNKRYIPIISFGITDETFAVASAKKGNMESSYLLGLELISYISWVSGTILGFIAGDFLPQSVKMSMNIALYAMFIAILIPIHTNAPNRKVISSRVHGRDKPGINLLTICADNTNNITSIITWTRTFSNPLLSPCSLII